MTIQFYHSKPSTSPDSFLTTLSPEMQQHWQNLKSNITAITLDLWGTILDDCQKPNEKIVYSERRQQYFLDKLKEQDQFFTYEQIQTAYTHVWSFFDKLWEQQKAFDAELGIREMLSFLNADLSPKVLQEVVIFFEDCHKLPLPLEGVLQAVKTLSEKYHLVLISDTAWTPGRELRRVLSDYGIADCFDGFVFSGETGCTKPHIKMFQNALNILDLAAHECLHVGDLQRTDIAGARNAGMRTAWIYRPMYAGKKQNDYAPDIVIKSVAQLADIL